MRLLLTNDDGINSPGLLLFAAALRKAGHRVFVLAPSADRSGVSHSITFLNMPRKIVRVDEDTWSCDGTPVDCVVIGLMGGLPECVPIDAIVSGINRGANLGTDLVYSGTAAAARQGALCHIPSLALSLLEGDAWYWDMAVAFALERFAEMLAFWKPDCFVNVNIPGQKENPRGLVHAFPSLRYYNDSIETYYAPDGQRYCFARSGEVSAKPEKGSDWEAVTGNNASISDILIHPALLGRDDVGKQVRMEQ
ncbi:MAG: 5'/3'-nucleotidase SurE [Treponema sp.]|jgi:5'-nucleotidase|nr:5'/3'-nucleotidase SurE [Treponema sp.]